MARPVIFYIYSLNRHFNYPDSKLLSLHKHVGLKFEALTLKCQQTLHEVSRYSPESRLCIRHRYTGQISHDSSCKLIAKLRSCGHIVPVKASASHNKRTRILYQSLSTSCDTLRTMLPVGICGYCTYRIRKMTKHIVEGGF